jgi:hypothetical protein
VTPSRRRLRRFRREQRSRHERERRTDQRGAPERRIDQCGTIGRTRDRSSITGRTTPVVRHGAPRVAAKQGITVDVNAPGRWPDGAEVAAIAAPPLGQIIGEMDRER